MGEWYNRFKKKKINFKHRPSDSSLVVDTMAGSTQADPYRNSSDGPPFWGWW